MEILGIDHLVVTVSDLDRTCEFYERVLGADPVTFDGGRRGLRVGDQKINLHLAGREYEPKAAVAEPGTDDFCVLTSTPIETVVDHLRDEGVDLVAGPVDKVGARGPLRSVYFRDPDGNLVEIGEFREIGEGGAGDELD
ncbi:VOC family protein [Haloferacaceae archaeon DSL9]